MGRPKGSFGNADTKALDIQSLPGCIESIVYDRNPLLPEVSIGYSNFEPELRTKKNVAVYSDG
jgi:hypothetical protein